MRTRRLRLTLLLLLGLVAPGSGHAQQSTIDPIPPHDSFTLWGRAVSETRHINVHTPPAYSDSAGPHFPVLYMPDGGIEEDFPHVVNTLDSLLAAGLIRPFIVVGIENTERRQDMTGPTTVASDSLIAPHVGGLTAFRAFIRDELMPEIRSRYRATDETAIVGESLAGLFIVETLLVEPKMFDSYIAMSPSLWWNNDALLRTVGGQLKGLAGLRRTLWVTAANEEGIAPQTDTLARILREQALPSLTLYYEPMPNEEHSTIYRAAAPLALRRVLGRR